jgi:hypothetical protein
MPVASRRSNLVRSRVVDDGREKARTSFTVAGHVGQQRRAVVATLGHVVIGKRRWLVTKKDLAKAIAEDMGLTQNQAKEYADATETIAVAA